MRKLKSSLADLLKIGKISLRVFTDYISHRYPKYLIREHHQTFDAPLSHEDTAILIQGPFDSTTTSKIIDHYIHLYPETPIIVVLWLNDARFQYRLRDLGVYCIVLDEPEQYNGNSDRMIYGVYQGLCWISKNLPDLKYVARTRSDQCIFKHDAIGLLKNVLEFYSLNTAKDKIITTSGATGKFRYFFVGDQFQFGSIEAITTWWNVPPFKEGYQQIVREPALRKSLEASNQALKGENYIALYNTLGSKDNYIYTFSSYIKFLKHKVIVVDDQSIGLRWYRHYLKKSLFPSIENHVDCKQFINERPKRLNPNMTHLEWLEMYHQDVDVIVQKYSYLSHEKWLEIGDVTSQNYSTQIIDLGGQSITNDTKTQNEKTQ